MPRRTSASISNLPRLNETWFVAINRLRTRVAPRKEKPYRPFLVSVMNHAIGTIRGSQIFPAMPSPQQVYDILVQAMRHPAPLGGARGVPHLVRVADSVPHLANGKVFLAEL
ncbi:hypothetical protein ANRL3_00796 [Anaerolineae bacterium]|nr:hypothetical protein ANRL3_00796 [Anaerolineae bacterium]